MSARMLFIVLVVGCADAGPAGSVAPGPEPLLATSGEEIDAVAAPSAAAAPDVEARPPRRTRDPLGLRGASPEAFVIEPDPEGGEEIAKLSLYEEDRFACEGADRVGFCKPDATSRVTIAGSAFVVLMSADHWEHDGMHGTQETVSLVSMEPSPRIVHTLTQFETDVFDCGSTVQMRRWAVVKGDAAELFCIESVVENGVGLFDVMDLEERGKLWHPLERKRTFRAFHWNTSARSLVEDTTAVGRCPKKGYAAFVSVADRSDILERRMSEQGESKTIPCPRELFGGCMVPFCEGKSKPKD